MRWYSQSSGWVEALSNIVGKSPICNAVSSLLAAAIVNTYMQSNTAIYTFCNICIYCTTSRNISYKTYVLEAFSTELIYGILLPTRPRSASSVPRRALDDFEDASLSVHDTDAGASGSCHQHGGFHSHGGNPKWLVYRANRIKMDDLGVPPFMETTNIVLMILLSVMGDLNFGTPVFPTFLVAGSELDAASLWSVPQWSDGVQLACPIFVWTKYDVMKGYLYDKYMCTLYIIYYTCMYICKCFWVVWCHDTSNIFNHYIHNRKQVWIYIYNIIYIYIYYIYIYYMYIIYYIYNIHIYIYNIIYI